eukprot:6183079-Pleurochrysis_carterae.AAC.2
MRFLVHASGERMFGLSLPGGAPSPTHTPVLLAVRAALLDALTFPLQALDACASPFLVATTNRAAVAVAPVAANTGMSPSTRTAKGGSVLWQGDLGHARWHAVLPPGLAGRI